MEIKTMASDMQHEDNQQGGKMLSLNLNKIGRAHV